MIRGVLPLQMVTNVTFHAALLACSVLAAIPCVAGDTNQPLDPLSRIVPLMERAQTDVQLPRQITREYHLNTPSSISPDSTVIAQMDFVPTARYVITKHVGSLRSEFVVKNVVQHELELSASNQKLQAAAITHQNYDFQFLGNDNFEGHTCYLLKLLPKREQAELIRGKVWVDQESFLVRRIEGDLAKSPSWWVKTAHVDIRFSDFQGMWLQTSFIAVADVRCFGAQQLTSRVLDSAGPSLAAKSVRHSPPSFAVAVH